MLEYRYVCPLCLKTFLDDDYQEDGFCWSCDEPLVIICYKKIKYLDCEIDLNLVD